MKRILTLAFILVGFGLNAQTTKTVASVDDWAEVAQNAVREGATTSINTGYAAILHIDVALSTATAHTGTKIEVQISSETSGDESWSTLVSFIGPTGTAVSLTPSGTEAGGQTVIETGATSGDYEADETRWVFFEDVVAVTASELMLLVSHVANTSITVLDGIANAKGTDDRVYSKAQRYVISLPFSTNRFRVIYDNTFDVDGSTVHTLCRVSQVTGI